VIKTVTGEDVSMKDLGGARSHNTKSGNAHYLSAAPRPRMQFGSRSSAGRATGRID
jgi:propionyl-CoA carboxylase beta chain